jgi:hypothetical protein
VSGISERIEPGDEEKRDQSQKAFKPDRAAPSDHDPDRGRSDDIEAAIRIILRTNHF